MSRFRRIACLPLLLVGALALPAVARADFGLVPGSVSAVPHNRNGSVSTQASSHPYTYDVHFALKTDAEGNIEGGEARDIIVDLPPGLVGNPQAVPLCPRQLFEGTTPKCPADTQIGVLHGVVVGLGQVTGPLFNLAAPPGSAGQLGFSLANFNALQNVSVTTEEGYGLKVGTFDLPVAISSATVSVWGVPADEGHDAERGETALSGGPPLAYGALPQAFLTLPASCGEPLEVTVEADSKLAPGIFDKQSSFSSSQIGCESVPFAPEISAQPTTGSSESSSGLNFMLKLRNQGLLSTEGTAETEPEKTEVALPVGVTVNPAAAGGLGVCTQKQYEGETAESSPGEGCPETSKLGTLVARTPLLEEAIQGSVYLAAPHDNRFGSLLALYIVARATERGVLVKQAGQVQADPHTGQLVTTFDGLPPLPYSSFEFDLREGPRAPLITPSICGTYSTQAKLYPFSSTGSPIERTAPFNINVGANGGACASSESQLPNKPNFEAGTLTPIAGAYSPFVFKVARNDGDQRFGAVEATLPEGLIGKLAGIPYCPNGQIAAAEALDKEGDGAVELASPSCSAASQVGVVNVGVGAGSQPYYAQGKVYLAGPYKGAPLSLAIITPAVAGPFDLGVVAVRTALYVNETTAQIHAVSDRLPSILFGIPLDVRSISLQMNRSDFTINPTNCQAQSVAGVVTALGGSTASVSNPFGIEGCKGLDFKPTLKLFFSGQMKRTGFPAIKAVLTQPKAENANIASTTVILPKGMLIANAHINNPCTRVQFNSTPVPGEGCPAKSVLGTAKAWTPLLENPEQGKVYFRSNGGERQLPDLVIALRGQIPLQLVGFIDSVGKKGAEIRRVRNRFVSVPDAPVSRFELKLSGGKKGLLESSKNLCHSKNKATFKLTGQNGKTHDSEPDVQVSCGKGSGGKKK
jgi:hypothetical protein